jgi:hypothetical protein
MNEKGAGNPDVSDKNYILGKSKEGEGFWYYYFIVFIFKTPFVLLLLLAASILFLIKRKEREGHPSSMLYLLGISFYFLFVLGVQNNVQIGIRHVLMVFPLLYVLSGFFTTTSFFKNKIRIAIPAIIIYTIATYYFFFPNLISYSNELVTDKKKAYKIMADSNLDFGQGRDAVEKYFKSNPGISFPDTIPSAGKFAVGINDYLGLKQGNKYQWIGRYQPVGHINHCYLLIEVKESDLNKNN